MGATLKQLFDVLSDIRDNTDGRGAVIIPSRTKSVHINLTQLESLATAANSLLTTIENNQSGVGNEIDILDDIKDVLDVMENNMSGAGNQIDLLDDQKDELQLINTKLASLLLLLDGSSAIDQFLENIQDTNSEIERWNREMTGKRSWYYEESFTPTVSGSIILKWPILSQTNLRNIDLNVNVAGVVVAKNYRLNIENTSNASRVAQIESILIFGSSTSNGDAQVPILRKLIGGQDTLVFEPLLGAPSWLVSEGIFTVSIRADVIEGGASSTAVAPVVAVTGGGTFTRAAIQNAIVSYS